MMIEDELSRGLANRRFVIENRWHIDSVFASYFRPPRED